MYLFVYKTSHTNGRYYIGRHQTDNIDDGYLGSGRWVSGIRDKSTLTREIIAEATSFEELCELEEYHISLHYGNPLCMNMKRASSGWSSEDVKEQVENGTHNFLGGEIGGKYSRQRVSDGTHHFLGENNPVHKRVRDGTHLWVGGDFQSKQQKARVENGTHHFLGGEVARVAAKKQVEAGTHHFLDGEISRKTTQRRLAEGTHNFQGDKNPSRQKVNSGTHHFQQPWECRHCGKTGKGVGLFKRWHGDNCKHR